MPKAAPSTIDPWKYDGPLRRADGRRAYNHYFWPLAEDRWCLSDQDNPLPLQRMAHPSHIAIVALADGRWSTEGTTYGVEANEDCYGRPCVFPTREKALRHAVARFIRQCRAARYWDGPTGITHAQCQLAINWALAIIARPPVTLPLPAPKPVKTGLPLFDLEAGHA